MHRRFGDKFLHMQSPGELLVAPLRDLYNALLLDGPFMALVSVPSPRLVDFDGGGATVFTSPSPSGPPFAGPARLLE
jgi:hypothetical protein